MEKPFQIIHDPIFIRKGTKLVSIWSLNAYTIQVSND